MIHAAIAKAYDVLADGRPITRELAMALAALDGEAVLDLVSLANKVRHRHAGPFEACSIVNARSGACSENCRFCAQAACHSTGAECYDLLGLDELLARAQAAHALGVSHFGLVTSGFGYPEVTPEFAAICEGITRIRAACPGLAVCASLGVLGPEAARRLAAAGVAHYNINLQVAPARYAELIADTHTVGQRIDTIRHLRAAGVTVCSGAILGVGETMADRIDLAFTLAELDVTVIPLNVLIPIAGTPLEGRAPLSAREVAHAFALFRLIHPRRVIKFAAGRETVMKDFQGLLLLAGANGFLTGGYLTTRGRDTAEDRALRREVEAFA